MHDRFIIASVIIICIFSSPALAQSPPILPNTDYALVDPMAYSQAAAREAWRPMADSENVSLIDTGGKKTLRMPCNFKGTRIERASWDRQIKLDLTMCKGLQFLFYCADASPVGHFSFYFRSGKGWYAGSFDAPASKGWGLVKIDKSTMRAEGEPSGWGNVDTIRISAWRGQDKDTEFHISALGLYGADSKIVIARGDAAGDSDPGETAAAKQYADIAAQLLDRTGLSYIVVSERDIEASRLKAAKLVILPYNPKMPDSTAKEIEKFVESGGKLIACYTLPNNLATVAGIRKGSHVKQTYPGWFASIRPTDSGLEGMPKTTQQASWNIQQAQPVEGRSRIAAVWHSKSGLSTREPALLISDNCAYLTHVMLADDTANKFRLLLAMIGNLSPELWQEAAQNGIDGIALFGPYENFTSAREGITTLASDTSDAISALDQAVEHRDRAVKLLAQNKFADAIFASEKARESMIEAYCSAQKPLAGEHRAFWCHSAFGVSGMSWEEAIEVLANNGFTAILPNMLWGGVAFYKSEVLPTSKTVAEKGDQIELCLAACKKYGVECHVWKVNWNMGWATEKEYMARMKAEGRTQVSYDLSPNDRWLCPSHPTNQRLEIDSMLEVARKYDVDGLHFDYIRYPGNDGCFCDGCRRRFEKSVGATVAKWPGDVRYSEKFREKWLDFRRKQITTVVEAVARQAKRIRPGIEISAAVFRNWPSDRDAVGQDWKLWCDKGYLDFVCPMDYTAFSSAFERMVTQQLPWAGKVPCYPGIGLSVWPDQTDICKLIEQINVTRRLGTGGFTIFNYGPAQASEVLPQLGKGMTKKAGR